MPNIPPFGLYSSRRSPDETPIGGFAPVVDVKATLPSSTTVRQVIEVWASNAAGVPKLVWAKDANSPTTAVITYVDATPAAGGHVHMTWTNPTPIRSDGYRILRPDGSVAGTTTQLATSFDDPAPKPLSGTYKLVALLGGVVDATPGVSNSLNLSTGPTSFVAGTNAAGTAGHLTWTAPTWGKPHQYQVFRDGGLYATLDGGTTTYDDTNPTRGATHTYQVFALLSSVKGGGTAASAVGFTPLDPINVGLTPATNLLQITFNYPGGAIARYEIQDYDGNSPGWINQDLNNVSGYSAWSTTTNVGYMRVRSIGVNGLPSNYVQVGPMASIVPVPFFGVGPLSVQASGLARFVVTTETFDQFCAEYYWANFPQYGWRTVFLSSGSSSAPCQTGDPFNNGVVWWDFERLQSTPVYARAKRVRNGVSSDWVQFGPV